MSQSSLEKQLQNAGVKVSRGVKVADDVRPVGASKQEIAKFNSGLWLHRWAKNSYINYPVVSRASGVRDLADSAKGIPSVIVGVGPSLDDAIEGLRGLSGRVLMISTDAAFRPLMANGVRPDLVLSFDCKAEQKLLWETVPAHDVPILFDSCAHPDVIASWKGPVVFYNHFHQADELSHIILPHVFPTIGQIPSGGTVGNSALLLSKVLGCSPAIVVGFDLCYKQEGTGWRYRSKDYHLVNGAWEETEITVLYDRAERFKRSFMKDFKGTAYRMDPELSYYHQVFLEFVTHFKVETINTSLYGALAEAIATFPLDEAIRRFAPDPAITVPFHTKIHQIKDPR